MTKRDEVRKRLKELEDANNGILSPAIVVKAAKDPNDVLHQYFTWDNDDAAHRHRLNEARSLIRSVKYVEKTTKVELQAPNYVHVPQGPKEQAYMSLDNVASDQSIAESVFIEEIKRAKAALDRARIVSEQLGPEKRSELEDIIQRLAGCAAMAA